MNQIPIERRVKWYSSSTKFYDKVVDGKPTFLVRSFFTSDKPDQIGDVIKREATMRAAEKWRAIANIRYMHQPEPIGKAIRIGEKDGLAWNEVECKIVDPKSQNLIREGVLGAMSVGIIVNDAEPVDPNNEDPFWFLTGGMLINDYDLAEISMVDHPMNLDAKVTDHPGAVHVQNRSYIFKAMDLDELLKKDPSTPTTGKDVTGGPEILVTDNNTHVEDTEDKAFGSDFPDAAFAVVENTGEKDEAGNTTPQTARHLPHHTKDVTDGNANDTVDLPHYRNALARVNQIKPVTDISKDELIKQAEAHLEKHRAVLEESLEPTKEQPVEEPKVTEPEQVKADGQPGDQTPPANDSGDSEMMGMMREMLDMMKQVLEAVKNEPQPSNEEMAHQPEQTQAAEPEAKKEEPVAEVKTNTTEVAKANSEGDLVKAITEVMDKSFGNFLAKAEEKDAALKKEILEYIEKLRNQAQPTQAALSVEDTKAKEPEKKTPDTVRKSLREVIEARFEQPKQG